MKPNIYLIILLIAVIFITSCAPKPVGEVPAAETEQIKEQEQPQAAEEPKPAENLVAQEPAQEATEQQPANSAVPCNLAPLQRQFSNTPYYTGPLFDAHIHLPGLPEIKKLSCTFDKEKVKGAIGFYWSSQQSQSLEKTLTEAESIKTDSSGKIRLFLMPKPYSLKTLEDIEATQKGLFTGYGEMAFYSRGNPSQSYYPQSPDEQQFLDLYVLAGKNNFVVMIHPDQGQESAIENVLQKNPNVKFYFHGEEIESAIMGLMDKYTNVYYSIDATLSRLPRSGDALHVSRTEEEYVSRVKQNFNAMLNGAVNDWKTKIEKHPDRFTWGTDRGGESWHYGEEVSRLFEELSRAFIGQLDPAVQEKFAYKNAEKLLQQR
ncbi:MAG: amidohydrolase family protein [Nanoarchaeota archaeon]|nr:amidohydrolase family protein [Nanoarchaeota archaeon]